MQSVLVLDSSYRPIKQVTWQKAMTMFFQDKIEVVKEYENTWIRSASKKFKLPAVIRLVDFIFRRAWGVKLTRTNIFIRDRGRCQYCNKQLSRQKLTIDHIIPSSKGGKTLWQNVVACCAKCNTKKGNKSLKEAGMTLLSKPKQPRTNFFVVLDDSVPEVWKDFIGY